MFLDGEEFLRDVAWIDIFTPEGLPDRRRSGLTIHESQGGEDMLGHVV